MDNTIKSITFNAYLPKFLLFGDSITQYAYSYDKGKTFVLGAQLSDIYVRRLSLVHRGFSGYNSEQGRFILPHILEAETAGKLKIAATTVFFGSNDAVVPDNSQYVSPERFEENVRFIAATLLDAGAKVILVGPAPHDEVHRNLIFQGDPADNPRSTMRNLEYSRIVEKVAGELDVGFVDLWHGFLESVGWKEGDPIPGRLADTPVEDRDKPSKIAPLLSDGLHFTGEGYRIWYQGIERVIQTKYPELEPANIPLLYPEWANARVEDLEKGSS